MTKLKREVFTFVSCLVCAVSILAAPDQTCRADAPNAKSVQRRDFTITVDYGLTIQQMINAGEYEWIHSLITAERFMVTSKGKVERTVTMLYFGRGLSERRQSLPVSRQ